MEAAENGIQAAKLETFLLGAAEAEAKGDLAAANRFFKAALFCEARMRPDVTDALGYVRSAGPLYPDAAVPVSGGSGAAAQA